MSDTRLETAIRRLLDFERTHAKLATSLPLTCPQGMDASDWRSWLHPTSRELLDAAEEAGIYGGAG
jgi:hypothetical protein